MKGLMVIMKNWRIFSIALVSGLLFGCASTVVPSNEYLLMDSSAYKVENGLDKDIPVQFMPVVVANYLSGNEMVLVSKQGVVHRSQNNLWAEPLATQLTRLTQQRLEKVLPEVSWFGRQRLPIDPIYQLNIEVDTFYADLDGMVHISGRWQLISPLGDLVSVHDFQVQDKLTSDGYATMTQTLAKNWFEKVIDPMTRDIKKAFEEQAQ